MAQSNLRTVNSLDVTLNLNNGFCKSYHKADDTVQYIDKKFNHRAVTKQLPVSIKKRLSNHSSDEKIFIESGDCYKDKKNKKGYTNKLFYHSPNASNLENEKMKRYMA